MKPDITLSRALLDPKLFGKTFAQASFWTWRVVGKLIDGIPLSEPREIELFEQCTGRAYNRQARRAVRRLILLAGRRAGKDRFLSAVAVWRAALCADWRLHQSAGEGAVVILLGADKKHAAILRRYCEGLLRAPLLAAEVIRQTGEVTEFRNGASLEIVACDARLVRGRSAIAVLGSECCHWRTDEHAASSDEEVVGAAEPSMAMCGDGGLLMLGSSVYRKRGYMYRKYKQLHGNEASDDLCWFASSQEMNPRLRQDTIDKAMSEDPRKAGAEYLNVWREDLSDFVPLDVVEGCSDFGVHMRSYDRQFSYTAFADAAGGTGADSFTLAIGHRLHDLDTVVIDVLREHRPRFVPRFVIAEYARLLKEYRISEVQGDRFAGGFHSDEWLRNGINFVPCESSTSENYLASLPMLLAGRVRLIDNATLRSQLASLERRVSSGDHEKVSHPQTASAHDDCATSVCGLLATAAQPSYDSSYRAFQPDYVDPDRPGAQTPAADQNLRNLLVGLDNAIKWGLLR